MSSTPRHYFSSHSMTRWKSLFSSGSKQSPRLFYLAIYMKSHSSSFSNTTQIATPSVRHLPMQHQHFKSAAPSSMPPFWSQTSDQNTELLPVKRHGHRFVLRCNRTLQYASWIGCPRIHSHAFSSTLYPTSRCSRWTWESSSSSYRTLCLLGLTQFIRTQRFHPFHRQRDPSTPDQTDLDFPRCRHLDPRSCYHWCVKSL